MPSSHLILCHPLLLLPSIPPSIRVFSNESTLGMRWPKYWSFSLSIIPSKEYPGLISFKMDWVDLLAVQGTLKSLLQHHSSKASVLQRSAFFTVQLSHPYMTTGKRNSINLYVNLFHFLHGYSSGGGRENSNPTSTSQRRDGNWRENRHQGPSFRHKETPWPYPHSTHPPLGEERGTERWKETREKIF